MVKDKAKNIFEEYWKALVEGILTAILLPYFMSLSPLIFIIGLFLIGIDIYVLYHSVEERDPKFLIIFLITEIFSGGSNNGK